MKYFSLPTPFSCHNCMHVRSLNVFFVTLKFQRTIYLQILFYYLTVDIFNWFIRKCVYLIISLISFGIIKCLIFRYIKCFFVNVWANLFHLLSFHLDVSSSTSWKIAVLKFIAFSFFLISLSVTFSFFYY